jgi:hypothetical protein
VAGARSAGETSSGNLDDVAARLSRLEREVATLAERVGRLDQLAASRVFLDPAVLSPATPRLAAGPDRSARIVTHIGQTLIALGVGYLLRALTEAGLVAHATGVWIGLSYAGGWIAVSCVGVRRGNRLAAWFAAALAPILTFPLVVEAALRFDLWSGQTALAVLAAVTAASLLAATSNGQQSIAWLTTLSAGAAAGVLMVGLRAYVAAELFYITLGIATLWLGYVRNWTGLRWPAALAADVVAVALVLRALNTDARESPHAVMAVLLLLTLSYSASIVTRTIVLNRPVVVFEVVQSLALLLLLRGALALAPLVGSARSWLGIAVLSLGVATFGTAVVFGERQKPLRVNAHFYSTFGAIVMLVGSGILLDGAALAVSCTILAALIAAVALRAGHESLMAHAVAFGVASAVPAGLIMYSTRALVASDVTALGPPPAIAIGTGGFIAALIWIAVRSVDCDSAPVRRAAAVAASLVLLWCAAGLAAGIAIGMGAGMSTVRTVVLSVAACAAAAARRWTPIAATAWAAYPLLAFVAVKSLAGDLRLDRPLALFVALAVYGAALIIIAHLGRRVST